ncbi:hypothetical protein Q5H92_13775 [Hymenobacter sp. M29]|uniref:KTSC domain-containing protein n=1 Tax=Hymenobacter mellowenesis TaxID=3063995 RepID=A0ABT9AC78_9BACT|nr:hypothetical protein [Hymenobacter sp. M29]MDO7847434.1 hypothetical protein [Hymenobacter sp. M29]
MQSRIGHIKPKPMARLQDDPRYYVDYDPDEMPFEDYYLTPEEMEAYEEEETRRDHHDAFTAIFAQMAAAKVRKSQHKVLAEKIQAASDLPEANTATPHPLLANPTRRGLRRRNAIIVEYQGQNYYLYELVLMLIPGCTKNRYSAIYCRIAKGGWAVEEAIFKPVNERPRAGHVNRLLPGSQAPSVPITTAATVTSEAGSPFRFRRNPPLMVEFQGRQIRFVDLVANHRPNATRSYYSAVRSRIFQYGWDVAEALTTPIGEAPPTLQRNQRQPVQL